MWLIKHRYLLSKGLPQPGNQYTTIAVTNIVSNSKIKRNIKQGNRTTFHTPTITTEPGSFTFAHWHCSTWHGRVVVLLNRFCQ